MNRWLTKHRLVAANTNLEEVRGATVAFAWTLSTWAAWGEEMRGDAQRQVHGAWRAGEESSGALGGTALCASAEGQFGKLSSVWGTGQYTYVKTIN